MLQSLLRDRFRLVLGSREQREMPVYDLVLDRDDKRLGASLIQVADDKDCDAERAKWRRQTTIPRGAIVFSPCVPIAGLITFAHAWVKDGLVLDKTGLTGAWFVGAHFGPTMSPVGSDLPSFSTALREQLGLRLERGRGLVDVFVIDAIEKPSEN